jgi:hypothetical protein
MFVSAAHTEADVDATIAAFERGLAALPAMVPEETGR